MLLQIVVVALIAVVAALVGGADAAALLHSFARILIDLGKAL